MKSKTAQLAFTSILESSFRTHERKFLRYMAENLEQYKVNARFITPNLRDPEEVFARIAFAILSANSPFNDSVKALDYAMEAIQSNPESPEFDPKALSAWKMVPAKATYLAELWSKLQSVGVLASLAKGDESWSEYRYSMQAMFRGLGIAKASFAVSLLYPLEAEVACIDTWMQKVFLGNSSFKQLGKADYERIEAKIGSYARKFRGCSTFLAQWMIWDHARGGKVNDHAIFPGTHKDLA